MRKKEINQSERNGSGSRRDEHRPELNFADSSHSEGEHVKAHVFCLPFSRFICVE